MRSVKFCLMNKIMAKLARQPNQLLQFSHNGQIKELLAELGIESQFTNTPPSEQETIQAAHFTEHPTHYILVARYLGYKHPMDNGHLAWCVPKKKYSLEQFVEFSKRLVSPTV
jgi:hypothetical protein